MPETNWKVEIDFKTGEEAFYYAFTATEQGIFNLLRMGYGVFEGKLKTMIQSPSGSLPHGMIDDAFVLLRCLVFNELQPHNGKFVKIARVNR